MTDNQNFLLKFPRTTAKFILHFAKKQWVKFSISIFASMTWAFSDAIFPYFLKRIVNVLENYQGNPANIFQDIWGILTLLIIAWVLSEILLRVQGFMQIYTFPEFRTDIRETVFSYVKLHSHDYFSTHFSGNIAKKISDLPTSAQAIMEIIVFQFVTVLSGALVILVLMWWVQPVFFFILLVWLCIHFAISILFVKFGDQLWQSHSESVSTLTGKIVDVFTNMLNVRLFARRRYELDYLQQFQEDEVKKLKRAMFWMEIMKLGLGLNGLLLLCAMIFTLLYGWSHGWVTIGDFTQIGMQSFWLLGWVWFISFQMMVLTREIGTVSAALSLVTQGHAIVDVPDAKPLKVTSGEIVFDNVNFGYRKSQLVFSGLNVRIAPGEKVGLVGFSGSGKSSFVNLILRFYDIQSGRILIDNQDISQVTQDSLRTGISMIPQEPVLFHRTLLENIQYGSLSSTMEEVVRVAKLAHCDEFVTQLDEGYHSLVGERGLKLSGGQRQRIAIARAILKNAPILILDEATSALDSVTEKLIHESLRYLMEGKTTIVVAHRLSTLSDMDRILVFDQGKIVEQGTQQELLAQNGYFARLWNMQVNGFLPESG